MNQALDELREILTRTRAEVAKVVIGQRLAVDLSLIAIFTNHHALVEGVPGVGKTLLVKTLAHTLGAVFNRIQFTPDLMPSDIIGTNIFNLQKNEFDFIPGPVFTTFLIGDEINRAPSKTQSALLQAMQERQVTVDRVTYDLSPNFTVFATQNPIEYEGTYALPEAQKDRFMLKIRMDLPDRDEELNLAKRMLGDQAPELVLNRGDVNIVVHEVDLPRLR
jgi:MoxR-like ATPase